jgi:hypothetical protein
MRPTAYIARVTIPGTALRRTLDAERWPAFVLDREGCIVFTNAAWDTVSAEVDGPSGARVAGSRWLAHIAGDELIEWHQALFERVLAQRRAEIHTAACNTPTWYRLFSTWYAPLVTQLGAAPEGMVVSTSMIEDAPVEARYRIAQPDEARHRQPTGIIVQCGGCRRVCVVGTTPRVWEFVPEYVAHRGNDVSHGLCQLCREVHYGMLPLRSG